SKGKGRGDETLPQEAPSLQAKGGLSYSLAWIQEKNFEERFEVVRVIGRGSIGEVSIVRRLSTSTYSRGPARETLSESGDDTNHSRYVCVCSFTPSSFTHDLSLVKSRIFSSPNILSSSVRAAPVFYPGGFLQHHRMYAMKSIHVNRLSKGMVEEFENEVEILQRLHHPNIIQLREVFYFKKKIYMCMTLCTGRILSPPHPHPPPPSKEKRFTYVLQKCPNVESHPPHTYLACVPCFLALCLSTGGQLNHRLFNEEQVCSVMSQVIRALVYMHETAMICHRDLKMENIMLESPNEPLVVKLIDFGLSKVFTEGNKMRTACGTVYTMAPEVLSGAGYTQKADLWSAGVIAFVLLCGSLPFLKDEADLNDEARIAAHLAHARFVFSAPAWKTISSGGKEFVRNLLKKQPGFRWTARQALDHCADKWGPSLSGSKNGDVSSQGELTSQTNSPRHEWVTFWELLGEQRFAGVSPGRMSETPSPSMSSESPTHSSRKRMRVVPGAIATSLRRFADYGELKKAALMVTAFQLDKEEIKQLKDAFLEVDTKGNGAISLEELRTVLLEHGVGGEEVDRVFGAVDMDNSGLLHYMEFLAATVEARGYIEEENLKEAFERLDVDSTGFISRDNLRAVLGKTYDNALIDKMLEEGDASASGSIDWNDFLAMMRPVVAQEYRMEAEAMLADTSPALKEATEVLK
ncbi:unnamed protein product, partial [Ascophyllum nodosum]